MIQSINRDSPPDVRNRFLESCAHAITFLVVATGSGESRIGIYAGHTEESITLREAGEEWGEKTRHVIPFAEVSKIELT